jgi:hypothetical protein
MNLMSYYSPRDEIFEKAKPVDEETWHNHISSFIKSFVVKEKRHRWHHLCLEKTEKAGRASSKIYSDLIWSLGSKIDSETQLALSKRQGKGVFYDFSGGAKWISVEDAFFVGHDFDGILSLEAGTLAIFFFHESEDFLFTK